LYKSTVIVTGFDMRSRPSGFARALHETLVKLSGEPRLDNDPRVNDLAARADKLVASFDYVDQMAGIPIHDEQGTYDRPYYLTVVFDRAKIDQALADLGEKPWFGVRPVIVPVFDVDRLTKSYLLSSENPAAADQAEAFADVAADLDLHVHVPTEAELKAWGVTHGQFPAPIAASTPEQAIVAGTLAFKEDLPGWVGTWRFKWRDAEYDWEISGVNFDSAFRNAIRGVLRIVSGHDGPT
ncbi:MAG: DUF2066 domain-containing protein, partial [Stellaceae bacterium]